MQLVGQTYAVLLRRPTLTSLVLEHLLHTFDRLPTPSPPAEGPPPGLTPKAAGDEKPPDGEVPAAGSKGGGLDGGAVVLARFSLHILAAGLMAGGETSEAIWGALWELHASIGGLLRLGVLVLNSSMREVCGSLLMLPRRNIMCCDNPQ